LQGRTGLTALEQKLKKDIKKTVSSIDWSVNDLIQRCLNKPSDEEAWGEFVARYHLAIKKNVAHALQHQAKSSPEHLIAITEEQIEDFAQAVYVRLIKDDRAALRNFKGNFDNSIFQYLLIISINVVRDYYRELRAVKRPQIVCSLEDLLTKQSEVLVFKELDALSSDAATEESAKLISAEIIDEIFAKTVKWQYKERDIMIFKLRYYEGLTNREIARIKGLKLSREGVGAIVTRTVNRLRNYLQDNDAPNNWKTPADDV
jgi:RNA polymerase sigma factor (sigma-70 family)